MREKALSLRAGLRWIKSRQRDDMKKHTTIHTTITERDYLRAHRKASREEEIALHGRPLPRSKPHRSKKIYDRKTQKAAFSGLPFDLYVILRKPISTSTALSYTRRSQIVRVCLSATDK